MLLVLGGWMLTGEVLIAFFDFEPGSSDNLIMIGIMAGVAAVPLLLGTLASPVNRWRELGLTLLIGAGLGLAMCVAMGAFLMDPTMQRYMPPPPQLTVAPIWGAANLLVVAGLGWLLYRKQSDVAGA